MRNPSLGTPMTNNATKVLLLGSGEIGKELTLSFQRLGLEVHAVDRYEHAPAHQSAHYSYIADICDPQQVEMLIDKVQPDFIVPEIETVATEALRRAEEDGRAVVVPTAKACELTLSREGIRRVASEELGLPTTAYRFAATVEEAQDAAEELGFPCIVKPAISTSGRGHTLVEAPEEIERAWHDAFEPHSIDPQVVVERFVNFDYEVTILAVRSIDPNTGELATWFCEPIGKRHSLGRLVEFWQPAPMSEGAMDNARSMAARITNALGGRGVYGVELFVAGDDVYFSSVTPRPHDTGALTTSTQRFSEFDLHARAIMGLPIDVTLTSPGAARFVHSSESLDTVSYLGVSTALAVPETEVRLFGKPNAYPGRRMGIVVSTADTIGQARQRAEAADRVITVGP
ncbi:formate-dependent phosphoribosylglycinamide formyltransferase [Corynebacterium cystitidis]|uniref:Formate-dependent phosphoribosylglycinamide formyltransferase n=1 Tax=Corynebacterium cystitidis DSM 20524 TaxID=1121357 RepID=A0A1H9V3L4_9CORY|nr:formate-dependent phosphoribosylglycinamide formyltransferase [Corynebacterium cystitidis]WJY83363.1 Phosphoribosylglycinamide formyltransferase 2 [Corynebacterium cystitidis DSM 20524]SES16262.1 phosphoribosylglycinamide formyltransferase 2 [Corynebacterium cystitidis DSM 20524]SNV62664.1 phosphoribosylglycinamide formyltransferase 2 [Corynebacterium cystitidis]